MDIQTSYKVLGINQAQDFAAIKAAHRNMIKRFHPDKFVSDAEAKQRAEEQSKLINIAFETIKVHIENNGSAKVESGYKSSSQEFKSTNCSSHWSYSWSEGEASGSYYRHGYQEFNSGPKGNKWSRADKVVRVFHSLFFVGILGFAINTLGLVEKIESISNVKVASLIK